MWNSPAMISTHLASLANFTMKRSRATAYCLTWNWASCGLRSVQTARTALAFRLLTLLGTRVHETLQAKWSDIDLSAATWTDPAEITKPNRAFVIYLPTQAVGMLQALPRWQGIDYVFSPNGRSAPGRHLNTAAENVVKAAGVKGWTPHDLRRTFRSGLDRLGIEPHVAELCLNHARPALERTYSPNVNVYAPKLRAAWQAYADHVHALIARKAEA